MSWRDRRIARDGIYIVKRHIAVRAEGPVREVAPIIGHGEKPTSQVVYPQMVWRDGRIQYAETAEHPRSYKAINSTTSFERNV
jgi:hypothetical protein